MVVANIGQTARSQFSKSAAKFVVSAFEVSQRESNSARANTTLLRPEAPGPAHC